MVQKLKVCLSLIRSCTVYKRMLFYTIKMKNNSSVNYLLIIFIMIMLLFSIIFTLGYAQVKENQLKDNFRYSNTTREYNYTISKYKHNNLGSYNRYL